MKGRCENPENPRYKDYGGRGITVFNVWSNSFEIWHAYMGDPPSPKNSIDRIDNNKGYEPGNVRWATNKEQCNNTRRNIVIEFNGQRHNLTQWSKITGIHFFTLLTRLHKLNWTIEEALTTPARIHH
jgi:hypothetical protein